MRLWTLNSLLHAAMYHMVHHIAMSIVEKQHGRKTRTKNQWLSGHHNGLQTISDELLSNFVFSRRQIRLSYCLTHGDLDYTSKAWASPSLI